MKDYRSINVTKKEIFADSKCKEDNKKSIRNIFYES